MLGRVDIPFLQVGLIDYVPICKGRHTRRRSGLLSVDLEIVRRNKREGHFVRNGFTGQGFGKAFNCLENGFKTPLRDVLYSFGKEVELTKASEEYW